MPTFDFPGEMTPGQFGPMSVDGLPRRYPVDLGLVPGRDALGDAHDEPEPGVGRLVHGLGGERGGTKIRDVFAPVSATACATVSNTGMPSTFWPALPGVTPATTFVP